MGEERRWRQQQRHDGGGTSVVAEIEAHEVLLRNAHVVDHAVRNGMSDARVQQLQGRTVPLIDEALMLRAKRNARGIVHKAKFIFSVGNEPHLKVGVARHGFVHSFAQQLAVDHVLQLEGLPEGVGGLPP